MGWIESTLIATVTSQRIALIAVAAISFGALAQNAMNELKRLLANPELLLMEG